MEINKSNQVQAEVEILRAQFNDLAAESIENMSRATRTKSPKVFSACKARRSELEARRSEVLAKINQLQGA